MKFFQAWLLGMSFCLALALLLAIPVHMAQGVEMVWVAVARSALPGAWALAALLTMVAISTLQGRMGVRVIAAAVRY